MVRENARKVTFCLKKERKKADFHKGSPPRLNPGESVHIAEVLPYAKIMDLGPSDLGHL